MQLGFHPVAVVSKLVQKLERQIYIYTKGETEHKKYKNTEYTKYKTQNKKINEKNIKKRVMWLENNK